MTTRLISFDIDGTLEVGEPPGPITLAMVRRARELGYIVGSCSDRPVGLQRAMWERLGIAIDFAVLKHRLGDARAQFAADEYAHVGTADRDDRYSALAGFLFLPAQTTTTAPWMTDARGEPLAPFEGSLSSTERARLGQG